MPMMQLDPTLTMFYEDDWFGEPWRQPEVALLVHGIAESSQAWYGWVPHLARHLRVVRPDQRGFGRSTLPPPSHAWSADGLAGDLAVLLDRLGVGAVHLIAAKYGGTVALTFAAAYPERVKTLSVFSPLVLAGTDSAGATRFSQMIREVGVKRWAEETQRTRLGSKASAAFLAGWNDLMGATDLEVCIGITRAGAQVDLLPILPRVQAPTLVATTEQSPLQSLEFVRDWVQRIPNAELRVFPGDSYHIAAVDPDGCAQQALQFLSRT